MKSIRKTTLFLFVVLIAEATVFLLRLNTTNPRREVPAASTGRTSIASHQDENQALLCAADNGDVAGVRLALQHGANPSAQGYGGDTALTTAARNGNASLVELLLNQKGDSVNQHDNGKNTSLMLSADSIYTTGDYTDVAKLLLAHGANVNARNNVGNTALMNAVASGDISITRLLLAHHAHVTARDGDGETVLTKALYSDNALALLPVLSKYGLRPSRHALGQALIRAASIGNTKYASSLLAMGADINAQDWLGNTALMGAAVQGDVVMTRFLLDRGANLALSAREDAEASNIGGTALEQAQAAGRTEIVQLLGERNTVKQMRSNIFPDSIRLPKKR